MKPRAVVTAVSAAVISASLVAAPASADHTKGKKYRDFELTREAATAANDGFGTAPEGTSGAGAMYLNAGQQRFCLFLDFEVPEGTSIVTLHLHEKNDEGNPEAGPVVIDASSLVDEDGTESRGCVPADQAVLRGVLSEPDDYYVNAHTSDGLTVIRGDIGRN